jgi:hypothetical protein
MTELLDIFVQSPFYIKLILIFWAFCFTAFVVVYPFALYHSVREFFGLNNKSKPSKF